MTDHRDHPAPDLLAALLQGLLLGSERDAVLSHLAECPDCRHCVMFLPETETLRQPAAKRTWRLIAGCATAAAAMAFFFTFAPYHRDASRLKNQPISANTVYLTTWKGRGFRHVRLTPPSDPAGTDALTTHLAGFRPKGNQVVVRSQYGDRWLTFDSFLSLAANDGSVSTVN